MDTFVIDFQAFKTLNNEFILKELAIVSIQTNHVEHCLIKPGKPFGTLPQKLRANINFLTRNIHGIYWEDGYVSEEDAIRLLKDIVKNASAIYCKGNERVSWLKKTLGMFVVDLDSISCPKSKKLFPAHLQFTLDCSYRAHTHNSRHRCSLQLALKYREWVRQSFSL